MIDLADPCYTNKKIMVEEVFLSSFCIPRYCTMGLSAKYSEIGVWGFGFSSSGPVWFGKFCEYLADNIPIFTNSMYIFFYIPQTRVLQYYTLAPSSWFLTTRHLPGRWAAGAIGKGRLGAVLKMCLFNAQPLGAAPPGVP